MSVPVSHAVAAVNALDTLAPDEQDRVLNAICIVAHGQLLRAASLILVEMAAMESRDRAALINSLRLLIRNSRDKWRGLQSFDDFDDDEVEDESNSPPQSDRNLAVGTRLHNVLQTTPMTLQEAADAIGVSKLDLDMVFVGAWTPPIEVQTSIERITGGKIKPSDWQTSLISSAKTGRATKEA